MVDAIVKLTEANRRKLDDLSRKTGKTVEDLVNEAVEQLASVGVGDDADEWKQDIMQAAGMWKDRTDLPDFDEVRGSMERRAWSR